MALGLVQPVAVGDILPVQTSQKDVKTAVVEALQIPVSMQNPISTAQQSTPALFSLKNTTTIVTGGGRGLGITLATAVIEAGGNVACLDILPSPSVEEWTVLLQEATTQDLGCSYHHCDITKEEDLQQTVNSIASAAQDRNAPLTGTIACAGIQQKLPAVDYPKTDFERILSVNVTGAFLTAKHTARKMIEEGTRGSIVLIASMSGNIANRVRTMALSRTVVR